MRNPKQVAGIKAAGRNWQGRETECEILEADGSRTRYRTTFLDTGEVFEGLWSNDNPRIRYACDEGRELIRVRTWRNGDELPEDKAGGYDYVDHCFCTVLRQVYGGEFTGYKGSYAYKDGVAWEKEDGDVFEGGLVISSPESVG